MLGVELNGARWWANDDEAFWERVGRGDWEPLTFAAFDRFIDPDRTYIDIGAWIGPTVLYAARRAHRCVALEPDPAAFARLSRNVALNPDLVDRIALLPLCLASVDAPVRLGNRTSSEGGDSMSSLLFAQEAVGWEVQGVTFERLLRQTGAQDCSFLKIDIEGGEFDLLPAMAESLAALRPTVHLSLHPRFLSDPGPSAARLRDVLGIWRHVLMADFSEADADVVCDPQTFDRCYELLLTDRL